MSEETYQSFAEFYPFYIKRASASHKPLASCCGTGLFYPSLSPVLRTCCTYALLSCPPPHRIWLVGMGHFLKRTAQQHSNIRCGVSEEISFFLGGLHGKNGDFLCRTRSGSGGVKSLEPVAHPSLSDIDNPCFVRCLQSVHAFA